MTTKEKREIGQSIWDEVTCKVINYEDPSPSRTYVAVSDKVKENHAVLKDVIRIIQNNYFKAVDDYIDASFVVVLDDNDKVAFYRRKRNRAVKTTTYPDFVGSSD